MIFNSKQLEELENIHDSTGAFEEEGDDDAGFDEVGEAAMDWRRGLIEEAAENVKRAKTRPVEPHIQYTIGSMLFDREARRFARVQRSIPGYLKIGYLSGGDREYGNLDVSSYLRDVGADKRLSELSEQLGMAEGDVFHELERLGITPLEEPDAVEGGEEAAAAEPDVPAFAAKGAPATAFDDEDGLDEEGDEEEEDEGEADEDSEGDEEYDYDDLDGDDADEEGDDGPRLTAASGKGAAKGAASKNAKAPVKGSGKSAKAAAPVNAGPARSAKAQPTAKAQTKPPQKAAKAASKPAPSAKKAAAPAAKKAGGKNANPIDDPNGYIKANFQELSNRELARLTGLSEHTIRRKLGEWGLKRKKEL